MRHALRPLLLFGLLVSALPGFAQALPPDLFLDENYQNPPPGHYRTGRNADTEATLTPAGYELRYLSAGGSIAQAMLPPGSRPNLAEDFVLEGELRGMGTIGLFWNGQKAPGGYEKTLMQMRLASAVPTVEVQQFRAGTWSMLLAPTPMTGGVAAADWHTIRIARTGATVAYWLDGVRLAEQPAPARPARDCGLALQNPGAVATLRRLRLWHHRIPIRLAPGIPATLRRERLTAPGLNTEREELGPMLSADGRYLYFSRVMGDIKAVDDGKAFNEDVFVTERGADGQWGAARALGPPINNDDTNFVTHVAPDGQTLLLGNRYGPDGLMLGQGFSRSQRRADGTWTPPEALPADMGTRADFGTRARNSCLDASSTVLLTSAVLATDPANTDLYYCRRQPDGAWSAPVALPASLKTEGNETTPFLAPDGKTLFFSSDGLPGYGSYDVFVTTRLDDTWTRWSEPLNLGPAVNTTRSDMYYSTSASGTDAYLVTSANDGRQGDIYRLAVPPAARPQATVLVRGRVLDATTGQPIATAEVRYEQLPAGTEAGVVLPAAAGAFAATLPAGLRYGLRATAPGYLSVNENLDLSATTAYREITQDLRLLPLVAELAGSAVKLQAAAPAPAVPGQVRGVAMPVAEEKITLNNLFFVQGKSVLLPASFPELNRLAETLTAHPALQIRLDGHTDNTGDAKDPKPNQVLSEQRADAVRAYLVKQGIDGARLSTRGYGGGRPVVPNDSEAHKARN